MAADPDCYPINHEDHEGSEVCLILRYLRDLRDKLS